LENRGINSDAHPGVPPLDPLESRTASEGAVGHYGRRKAATPPGIMEVLPELTESSLDGYGWAVRGGHKRKLRVP
jgi:hypothetical protein